jgi:hypothetical protein
MNTFKNYVTSTAFNLRITTPMINVLCKAHHYGEAYSSTRVFNALIERGLVESVEIPFKYPDIEQQIGKKLNFVKLSEVGKLLMPLLDAAGLVAELDDSQRIAA